MKLRRKRKRIADCPFSVVQARVDRLCEKLRNPPPPDMSKIKKMYPWRKWNGKTRRWEKIWKPYPPRDPYKARQD